MAHLAAPPVELPAQRRFRVDSGLIGLIVLLVIALPCFVTLPWAVQQYDQQGAGAAMEAQSPTMEQPLGTDHLGRSLLWRCLLGGAISLSVGCFSALIAVGIGVSWGAVSGFAGGRVDALMMRTVDVLYGLPYILLVVLLDLALKPVIESVVGVLLPAVTAASLADVLTLLLAIGGVAWLTMARVIRGQVLSLREQPFIEAARASGFGPVRILLRHVLPNTLGPIIVYATLTIPVAILQESFLSFLGIGIQAPLPSWGNLAADGVEQMQSLGLGLRVRWWIPLWPCLFLGLTLMALNFLGDALRQRWDPRSVLT